MSILIFIKFPVTEEIKVLIQTLKTFLGTVILIGFPEFRVVFKLKGTTTEIPGVTASEKEA